MTSRRNNFHRISQSERRASEGEFAVRRIPPADLRGVAVDFNFLPKQ
jgi:hypothetical protein